MERARELFKQKVPHDFPELVTVLSEMDRVGDELLSRLPPPPPLPMPAWLLAKYPNLSKPLKPGR